jgi:hypothetical protein
LERDSTMTFLQNDSQKTNILSFKASPNILFRLSNYISLEKSRPEAGLDVDHDGKNASKRDAALKPTDSEAAI